MHCPDHHTIFAFADGELDLVQTGEVERHVGECSNCRQLLEELQWLDTCGRTALDAIPVGEAPVTNIVWWRPRRLKPLRLAPLAAAAAVVIALSIWAWRGSLHPSHQPAVSPHESASARATMHGAVGQSVESQDRAFEQWAAQYEELEIPRVPMEVAASYVPAPISPIQIDDFERNSR